MLASCNLNFPFSLWSVGKKKARSKDAAKNAYPALDNVCLLCIEGGAIK